MQFDFLNELVQNIGKLFSDQCEVVIHDFTNGFDNTIVKIVNGHVSGRAVGACPTNLLFDSYKALNDYEQQGSPVYFTKTEDGRILKCCTSIIRDESGSACGAVCINYDITPLMQHQHVLERFVGTPGDSMQSEHHYQSVNELLAHYLSIAEKMIGKSGHDMDKNERIRALTFLNDHGILQISKAHITLCDFFGVSKYTLYSCLDEIKKQNDITKQ